MLPANQHGRRCKMALRENSGSDTARHEFKQNEIKLIYTLDATRNSPQTNARNNVEIR